MTRKQAIATHRKGEITVRYQRHDEFCLFSDGTIVPPYPCTCGSKRYAYTNVLKKG